MYRVDTSSAEHDLIAVPGAWRLALDQREDQIKRSEVRRERAKGKRTTSVPNEGLFVLGNLQKRNRYMTEWVCAPRTEISTAQSRGVGRHDGEMTGVVDGGSMGVMDLVVEGSKRHIAQQVTANLIQTPKSQDLLRGF